MTHASAETGESYDLENIQQEQLPSSVWEKGIYASDMDQTMFLNDIGALVFIQYLQDPSFYTVSPEEFRRILMPAGTEWFFEKGVKGEIDGVSQKDCAEVVCLFDEIAEAFEQLREEMLSTNPLPETRMHMYAFMEKICMLDSMLINVKNQHRNAIESNDLAKAFARIRLYRGQEKAIFDRLTHEAFALSHDHPERMLPIRAGDSKTAEVDRLIRVNRSTYGILKEVSSEGANGYVVTASPLPIASRAIRSSVFQTLVTDDQIIATKLSLSSCGQRLDGKVDGDFVAGIRKSQLLEKLTVETKKKVMLAIGDLPGSDAAMGAMALSNGGVFVVTHKCDELEESRNGFDEYLKRIMGARALDRVQERIWYVPSLALDLQITNAQR